MQMTNRLIQLLAWCIYLFPVVDGIVQAPEQRDSLIQRRLLIKLNPQHAFLKIAVMYDTDIFDRNPSLCEQRGDGGNRASFIGNVYIAGKYLGDRTSWQIREGVAVFLGGSEQIIGEAVLFCPHSAADRL